MSFTLNISYTKSLLEMVIDAFVVPATLTTFPRKQFNKNREIRQKMPNF